MVGGKRRSHRFLCFRVGAGAVVGDDEETEPGSDRSGGDINCKASRRCRRRLLPRVFSRLLRSRSAEDRSQKQLDIRSLSSESSLPEKKLLGSFHRSESSLPEKKLLGSFHRSPNDGDSPFSEPMFSSSASSSSTSSSSLSSASSLVSSVSTSPIMAPEVPTIQQRKLPTQTGSRRFVSLPARRKYNPTTGLCILLVSLSVLVFSGKLCAILWTSTCLCLTPRRRGGGKPQGGAAPEVRRMRSLEGDKKRIVLAGFLDRNRKV